MHATLASSSGVGRCNSHGTACDVVSASMPCMRWVHARRPLPILYSLREQACLPALAHMALFAGAFFYLICLLAGPCSQGLTSKYLKTFFCTHWFPG